MVTRRFVAALGALALVTGFADRVSAETSSTSATPSASAVQAEAPSRLSVTVDGGKLSAEVANAEIKDVLMAIGKAVPAPVDIGDGVTGKVTASFKAMSLEEGLSAVVSGAGVGIIVGFNKAGAVQFIKVTRKVGTDHPTVVAVRKVREFFTPWQQKDSLDLEEVRELTKNLQDPSKKKQWGRLAGKIIDIRIKTAKPYLRELMDHPEDYIRWEATDAFCRLADVEDADFLLDMATDKERNRRAVVAYTAMPLVDDPRQIPLLLEMLKDKWGSVQEGAFRALASKRAQEAVPALEAILRSGAKSTRAQAAEALTVITGKEYDYMTPEERRELEEEVRRDKEEVRKRREGSK